MSKRFGRQQKRKMRERIKNLEAMAMIERRIGARNREIVENTAMVLGNHFMTLPAKSVEVRELDELLRDWRMPAYEGPLNYRASQPATFCEVALPILQGGTSVYDLRPHMHVTFKLAGHYAGYAIKPESLMLYDKKRRIELMATEIARQLAYHLNNSLEAAHES